MASAYLDNLSNGKNPDGSAASAGNIAWAKDQIAKAPTAAPISGASTGNTGIGAGVGGTMPKTAQPSSPTTGTAPMVGPVLPGTARPNVPVSASVGAMAGATAGIPASNINQYGGVGQAPYGPPSTTAPAAQPSTPVAAQPTATPQSQGSYPGQLTTAQIQQEAQARIDKQRAALMNAVTGAKTGAKNTYDYTQGLQKDNRTLEDAQFQRNNNPFSGGTDYKEAMVNRDRQIADTASSKDYNNTIAGYDAQVASFDTLAPEQQSALIDDLTRQERQYGLDVGSLTGQFNGSQTLAAKTADQNYQLGLSGLSGQLPASAGGGQTIQGQTAQLNNQGQAINNQLDQLKLNDYPAESQAQAQLVQQQLKSGQINQDAAAYNLQQLKDPNSPSNQAAKLDLQMKQIDASNYSQESKLKLQQLQKQIADIGVVHKTPQTAAQIEYDQQQVVKIKAEIEKLNKPDPSASETVEDYSKKYLDGLAKYDNEGKLTNGPAVESQILSSGKTEADMRQMYARYGLTWG